MSLKAQIEQILEEKIRPMVARHAGGIELVDVEEPTGIVKIRFQGTCVGCPLSTITLKAGVEAELMEQIPEVREVIAVNEKGEMENLDMEEDEDLKDWGKE